MERVLRHGRMHFGAIASCVAACYPGMSQQVYVQVRLHDQREIACAAVQR